MAKKKISDAKILSTVEFQEKKEKYIKLLKENPQYSLLVDPENKYNFSSEEKNFIGLYCEFKNIELAALLSKISSEQALTIFGSYAAQQEIRRINMALYQKQFEKKMLTLEQIGGYLTSLITDDVSTGDKISGKEKLQATNLIVRIHELLNNSTKKPGDILEIDIEEELSNLSLDTLKRLLESSNDNEVKKDKEEIIQEFKKYNSLTDEEISYLKTLSIPELLTMINEIEETLQKEKK